MSNITRLIMYENKLNLELEVRIYQRKNIDWIFVRDMC